MTFNEITQAVNDGKSVCWSNSLYDVVKGHGPAADKWFIVCNQNQYTTGLTLRDGKTLVDKEIEFFINE